MIVGIKEELIRKKYFSGGLSDILASFLEKEATPEDYQMLDTFLASLTEEAQKVKEAFSKFANPDELKPPSAESLMVLNEEQKEKLNQWEIERNRDYEKAKIIIAESRRAANVGGAKAEDWLKWGLDLATYQFSLDQYRVWQDQLYRARLTEIMDVYGVSRAEAEERAKLTNEYRDYKNAVLFREMVEETIKILKKYAGINY